MEENSLKHLKRRISGMSLLDKLATADTIREARVAFFVKKLLQTIRQLHSRNTAHLDLKPENIMVSESVEDQIKLLDFGSSRKLDSDRPTIAGMSVPEFVAPEIILGKPVTLAADMWSVGVLTYVLLSGVSPFIGDSDAETLANVEACRWTYEQEHFNLISGVAKDFVSNLLLIDPSKRLTVDQALEHQWLILAVDSENKGAILNTEFLKEFKYKHQWVDRRIFVKSSPNEEETEDIAPSGLDLYFSPNMSLEPSQTQSFVAATLSLPSFGRVLNDVEPQQNHVNDGLCEDGSNYNQVGHNGDTAPNSGQYVNMVTVPENSSDLETVKAIPISNFGSKELPPLDGKAGPSVKAEQALSNGRMRDSEKEKHNYSVVNGISDQNKAIHTKSPSKPDCVQSCDSNIDSVNEFNDLMDQVKKAKDDFRKRNKAVQNMATIFDDDDDDDQKQPGLSEIDLNAYRSVAPTRLELFKQSLPPDPTYRHPKQSAAHEGFADDFPVEKVALEDLDWESDYQIGPETYLLQLRDSGLASRIRTYRRELFPGDQATFIENSCLTVLNNSISVKERRRYTDVIREDEDIRHNMERLESKDDGPGSQFPPINKFRRVNLIPCVIQPANEATNKGHGPIFYSRLRDTTFALDGAIELSCILFAQPEAEIQWYRNDELVLTGDEGRVTTGYSNGKAALSFDSVRTTDAGLYKCLVTNEHGSSWCAALLKLGEPPEQPSRPEVELVSDSEIFMSWTLPSRTDTSDDVESFKIEHRSAGEGQWSSPWILLSSTVTEEACLIRLRATQGVFQFRATAKNKFGWGEPSLASRTIELDLRGARQLNIELLKNEVPFSTISVPQNSTADAPMGTLSECNGIQTTCPRPTQPGADSSELSSKNDSPSRFLLESEIFRGRYCIVKNCTDTAQSDTRQCVVKILLANQESKTAAMNEAEFLRDINHENVVNVLSAFLRNDFIFIFMDKMYESLFQRFAHHDYYTEDNIARVVNQLLCAMQWIHYKRIIYLNVQPDNIMFASTRSWDVKLIDFGSAVRLDNQGEAKLKGNDFSNPDFSAPELLQHGFVVPSSDVWGVGLLMYILMSGYHPFNTTADESAEEVIRSITQTRLDLTYVHSSASEGALRFLSWSLKKHPSNRMTSEEGLQHCWLSMQSCALRRRQNIKYSSNKLRSYERSFVKKRRTAKSIDIQFPSSLCTGDSPA